MSEMPELPPRRVLLMGLMGSGKTTVGRELSSRTGWPYVDNDDLVLRSTGRTPPELLRDAGQEAMRAAESDALTVALGIPAPLIAGVAGGVVLDADERARIATSGALVVWLRARVSTLARRVGRGGDRAWLESTPAEALARLAAERELHYAELADLVIDVDDLAPPAVAMRVMTAL